LGDGFRRPVAGGSVLRTVAKTHARAALVIGFAVLISVRIPALWPYGRLWAEEGVVYLANAWAAPWYAGLFTIHTGYLNLPASGATALAVHLVSLEHVPLVTVLVALLFQVCPAILLAVSGISWLRDWRMLALALLLIALPPYAEEVWLGTISSQYHLMLATAIILASPPGRGAVRWFHGPVLLLAPLCGPGGALLLPLYVLRAWFDRSLPRLRQALFLLPGVLVQFSVVLTHPEPARMIGLNVPVALAAITGKQILLPLLGAGLARQLTRDLPAAFAAGHMPILAVLAPVVVFGALGAALWRCNNAEVRWFFAASMIIMIISYLAALTPGGPLDLVPVDFGNRYYFAPAAINGLILLGLAATGPRTGQLLARVMVAWLLLIGMVYYPHVTPAMARGPSWPEEVAKWRADPTHPIAIWPAGWAVSLAPRRQ
jgi:hypothetical protein